MSMLLLLLGGADYLVKVSDTDILQKPVDCVLAGDQNWERTWRTSEIHKSVSKSVKIGHAGILNEGKSSFTSKTGNRGYD